MDLFEFTAASLGVLSVYWTAKENPWSWPVGAVMVGLYSYVFWGAKLYADMLLHVIYFGLQIWGWWEWTKKRQEKSDLKVSVASVNLIVMSVGFGAFFALIFGFLLKKTDASLPFFDAAIASFSLAAQYLMAKKYLQHWLFWAVIDSAAIVMFAIKGLYATMLLYAVFLGLCVLGYKSWRKVILA